MNAGIKHFFTKVVGVTHCNDDGTSRQAIIRRCAQLEQLDLVPQKDNPYDPNAVRVCRSSGEQLGFLGQQCAQITVEQLNSGHRFGVYISNITGGEPSAPTLGANLLVVVVPAEVSHAEAENYVKALISELTSKGEFIPPWVSTHGMNYGRQPTQTNEPPDFLESLSSTVEVVCPGCGETIAVDSAAGSLFTCSMCNTKFTI